MKQKRNGREGLKFGGVIKAIAISSILIAVTCVHDTAAAQTTADNAASARAFLTASQVLLHPRCVNCHPAGDAPLQGDESKPHSMNVKRGPDGKGKSAMRCSNCHQTANQPGAHMPPGGPGWHLPPENMPMVFEKRTPRDLCLQMKDPARNGNKTLKEVLEHVRSEPLVLWGWSPGEGRTPVPVPHRVFVKSMEDWVEGGSSCPE